jgi:hypothetical protein
LQVLENGISAFVQFKNNTLSAEAISTLFVFDYERTAKNYAVFACSPCLFGWDRVVLYDLSGDVVEKLVDIAPSLGRSLKEGDSVLLREILALLCGNNSLLRICFVCY